MRKTNKKYRDPVSNVTVTQNDSVPRGFYLNNTECGVFGLDISEYDYRCIEHTNPNNPMEANLIIKQLKHLSTRKVPSITI